MARLAKPKPKPLYTWAYKSSQARGGTVISYITQLNPDHTLSCDCPGWIFNRESPKKCKHTRLAIDEVPGILAQIARGETLRLVDISTGSIVQQSSNDTTLVSSKNSANRVIDL